jgi:hypothetical protein
MKSLPGKKEAWVRRQQNKSTAELQVNQTNPKEIATSKNENERPGRKNTLNADQQSPGVR